MRSRHIFGVAALRAMGLGESRHDTHEQFAMKDLLIRYMVEEMGFRILIFEESIPHAEALDRYVRTGEGDPRGILSQLAGWYLWDTEEMSDLLRWAREFNRDRSPDNMLRIYGMDITAPALGMFEVLAELERVGVAVEYDATALGLDLQSGDYWPTTRQRYAELSDVRLDELRESYLGLRREVIAQRSRLTNALSRVEYERLLFLADCGVSGNEFFSTSNREQAGAIRERGMADAVIWTLERSSSKPKAIVGTHNLHAAKDSFRMPELAEGRLEPMGIRLRHALGESYLAFGGTFGSGTFPANLPPGGRVFEARGDEVMDGALSRVGTRNYLLDLRSVESSSAPGRWLRMERAWIAQDSDALLRSNEAFDAVYYVSRISRAQPTPRALRRFAMLLGNP